MFGLVLVCTKQYHPMLSYILLLGGSCGDLQVVAKVCVCLLVCPSLHHHYRCIPGYQGNMTDEETDGTTSGAVIMCTLQQDQPHPPNTVGWS